MKKIPNSIVIIFLLCSPIFASQDATKILAPSTTYNVAQTVKWINDDVFVVGRWDGTISVFREPIGNDESGPVIIQAFTTPGRKAIEMLQKVGKTYLVSSNTSRSMAVWSIHNDILVLDSILQYNAKLGTANASTDLLIGGKLWLVVGHANGFVSEWVYQGDEFKLVREVDVRTSSAPANPFSLYNIRGVVPFKNDLVILASEDGDISLFRVSTGEILIRQRYNQDAKRGINSISYDGEGSVSFLV
jgi:hypothetical protein